MQTRLSDRFKLFFNYNGRHVITNVNQLHGGMTNKTFLVRTTSNEYVARLPGEGIGETIDREVESYNTQVAYLAGVTPEIDYEEKAGNKVTRYLKHPSTMTKDTIQQPDNFSLACQVLRKLHTSKDPFKNIVNIFDINRKTLIKLQTTNSLLSAEHLRVAKEIELIEHQINALPFALTPCHNDTTTTNFILSEGKMYLIDFEYSGNNDPMWDLAILSNEAELTEEQDNLMFSAYYSGEAANTEETKRFQLYKPVVGFWVTLWCLVQLLSLSNEDDKIPIRSLLDKHFTKCQQLLGSMQNLESISARRLNNK